VAGIALTPEQRTVFTDVAGHKELLGNLEHRQREISQKMRTDIEKQAAILKDSTFSVISAAEIDIFREISKSVDSYHLLKGDKESFKTLLNDPKSKTEKDEVHHAVVSSPFTLLSSHFCNSIFPAIFPPV